MCHMGELVQTSWPKVPCEPRLVGGVKGHNMNNIHSREAPRVAGELHEEETQMKSGVLRIFIAAVFVGLMMGSASTALCKDKHKVPPKDAEPATAQANAKVWQELPFSNKDDFTDAEQRLHRYDTRRAHLRG